ncbi:hypothetical protein CTAYLR_001927 [Chrysophaeum taylorii]|uniref:Uncharacterized protein n=1 Tax=Chrysophaeum taylorii TaxID=2483200 RepID=A0AAD7XJ76_9STRA|nr:hypothetical protein CTAYLR_001927 [Chrysophaeum taylorii]
MPTKKSGGKKEVAAAPRCECPSRCTCGIRPERPSHGHKWDGDQQKWVGRGAREQRVAAKLTDTGPREADGVKVETWQKLPWAILSEYCQREKRPKPTWHPTARGDGIRARVVLADKKRKDKDLAFCPNEAFESEAIAKEAAALLALHHVQGDLPLERKLPEPFKTMWTDKRLTATRAFASRAEREQHARAQTAKRNAATARREAYERANPDAKVYMARRVREDLRALLSVETRGDDYDDDEADEIDDLGEEEDRHAASHVVALGFSPVRALAALRATSSTAPRERVEAMLSWLCLHTPEEELPDGFDPDGANLDVVVVATPKKKKKELPKTADEAKRLWMECHPDAAAARCVDDLGQWREDAAEEIEALRLSCDVDEIQLPGFGTALGVNGTTLLVPYAYPAVPAAAVRASEAATKQLSALARERLDEPALFELCAFEEEEEEEEEEGPVVVVTPRTSTATATTAAPQQPHTQRRSSWWEAPGVAASESPASEERSRLPAAAAADEVRRLVGRHRVVLIEGGTGCGKTTQIPQFLLEDGAPKKKKKKKKIVVAQPRRLAAIGVAGRVADERGERLGSTVGCMVRGESHASQHTALLFCTTGVVLQRLRQDPELKGVTHVIVDEVHERSLDADILLALLKNMDSERRRHLKVVLMSATLDTSKFLSYFDDDDVGRLEIPGRTFPVDVRYLDELPIVAGKKPMLALAKEVALQVAEKAASEGGAVLVFVASIGDVSRLVGDLGKFEWIAARPLHGSLAAAAQRQAFSRAPTGKVKVVVSTNVAETSITIPDITVVVDTCRANVAGFDAAKNLPCLSETWIARDSADQRKGRAGRVRRGECCRLVTRQFFEDHLAPHSTPEIARVSLESLAIQALSTRTSPAAFSRRLIDPPDPRAVDAAVDALRVTGAVDDEEDRLTALGTHLAALPCAARLGKLVLLGAALGSNTRDAALTIAAGLSCRPVWRSGPDERQKVDATKKQLRAESQCGRSDHALVALAFDAFAGSRKLCEARGVSFDALEEIRKARRQLDDGLKALGFVNSTTAATVPGSGPGLWRVVRALVAAALYPRVLKIEKPRTRYAESASGAVAVDAKAKELRFFRRQERVFLHPASATFGERAWPSPWAVYNECTDLHGKMTVRDCSEASPYALLLFGGRLTPIPSRGLITVGENDWLRFSAHPRVAVIVAALRIQFDALLAAKTATPMAVDTSANPITHAIVRLLLHDGFS